MVCVLVIAIDPSVTFGRELYPWNAYIGANNRDAPWAGFLRGIGRGYTGLALSGTDALVPRATTPAFGKFAADVAGIAKSRDLIIQVGGLLSAREAQRTRAFMTMIEADRGELWRHTVYLQARRLAEVTDRDRIYWQVGNEINAWHYTRSFRLWQGKDSQTRDADQDAVIPLYVEYFLAPTVAALNAASRDIAGRNDTIPIVLGTLAGAYRERSRAWLDSLLNYQVRGDFAPELAGSRVRELIDIVAIHYLQTHADNSWSQALDDLREKWVGSGRIKGIWATEELGVHQAETGIGAATAVKVTARCLNFHLTRAIPPRQGRCGLWGWWLGNPGTRGDEAMTLLSNFLGDAPLAPRDDGGKLVATGSLEWHAFTTVAGESRTVVAIYPPSIGAVGALAGFTVSAPAAHDHITVTAYHFSQQGRQEIKVEVEHSANSYRVQMPAAIRLHKGASVLVLIGPGRPATGTAVKG